MTHSKEGGVDAVKEIGAKQLVGLVLEEKGSSRGGAGDTFEFVWKRFLFKIIPLRRMIVRGEKKGVAVGSENAKVVVFR